jgi:hypothetical protein
MKLLPHKPCHTMLSKGERQPTTAPAVLSCTVPELQLPQRHVDSLGPAQQKKGGERTWVDCSISLYNVLDGPPTD